MEELKLSGGKYGAVLVFDPKTTPVKRKGTTAKNDSEIPEKRPRKAPKKEESDGDEPLVNKQKKTKKKGAETEAKTPEKKKPKKPAKKLTDEEDGLDESKGRKQKKAGTKTPEKAPTKDDENIDENDEDEPLVNQQKKPQKKAGAKVETKTPEKAVKKLEDEAHGHEEPKARKQKKATAKTEPKSPEKEPTNEDDEDSDAEETKTDEQKEVQERPINGAMQKRIRKRIDYNEQTPPIPQKRGKKNTENGEIMTDAMKEVLEKVPVPKKRGKKNTTENGETMEAMTDAMKEVLQKREARKATKKKVEKEVVVKASTSKGRGKANGGAPKTHMDVVQLDLSEDSSSCLPSSEFSTSSDGKNVTKRRGKK